MNVELYPDGSVPAPQLAILEDIGAWLRTHGEAIYETRPWKVYGQVSRNGKPAPGAGHFNERTVDSPPYAPEEVRFTTRGRSLYAIVLNPRPGRLLIRPLGLDADTRPGRVRRVDMLGHRAEIPFEQSADGLAVTLPNKLPTSYAVALKIEGAIPE
jgi:alpha-L-fucosidase